MPPGIFRSFEAVDATLVHVVAMREPDENQELSRTAAQQRVNHPDRRHCMRVADDDGRLRATPTV